MSRPLIFVTLAVLVAMGAIGAVLVLRIADRAPPELVMVAVPAQQKPVAPEPLPAEPPPKPEDAEALEALNRKIREIAAAESVLTEDNGDRVLAKRLRDGMRPGDQEGNGVRIGAAFATEAHEQRVYEKVRNAQLSKEERAREELQQRQQREAAVDVRCRGKWKPGAKTTVRTATRQKLEVGARTPPGAGFDKEKIDDDGRDLGLLIDAARSLEQCTEALKMVDRWAVTR